MCLAVPGQLVECDADAAEAVVSMHGNRLRISTALVPDARAGDWVLVHAGFAIQRIEGTDLEETWAILEDLKAAGQGGQR